MPLSWMLEINVAEGTFKTYSLLLPFIIDEIKRLLVITSGHREEVSNPGKVISYQAES